jgi:hypothetical protein
MPRLRTWTLFFGLAGALLALLAGTAISKKPLDNIAFSALASRLPHWESPRIWTSAANDTRLADSQRRDAVILLFQRHVACRVPGLKLHEFIDTLGPFDWLEDDKISRVGPIAPYVPSDFTSRNSVISLALFPENEREGDYIYLGISGCIRRQEFIDLVRGKNVPTRVRNAVIVEMAIYDPTRSKCMWFPRKN